MGRLIFLGVSNVYRNVTPDRLAKRVGHSVSLINATKRQTFEIGIKEVAKHPGETLIVSCLANLLCDEAAIVSPIDLVPKLQSTLDQCVGLLMKSLQNSGRILLVPLFIRTTPSWFPDHIQMLNTRLETLVKSDPKFVLLPEFKIKVSDLLSDGVHLSPDVGVKFNDYVVSCYLDLLPPALEISHSQPSGSGDSTSHVLPAIFTSSAEPTISDVMDLL